MLKTIVIAKEFSRFPAGRYKGDGPFPGETFRDKHLVPALKAYSQVEVILDGASGYGSSFLEESFGGLVRRKLFSKEELQEKLLITAETTKFNHYIGKIWEYINNAIPGDF